MRPQTCLALILLALATPAAAETVDVLYVGPADGAEWRGVRLGIDEANVQGGFTGRSYVLHRTGDGEPLPEVEPAMVLAAGGRERLEELVERYSAPATAVLNLTLADDDLRRACRRNLLHVLLIGGLLLACSRLRARPVPCLTQ